MVYVISVVGEIFWVFMCLVICGRGGRVYLLLIVFLKVWWFD